MGWGRGGDTSTFITVISTAINGEGKSAVSGIAGVFSFVFIVVS